MNFEVEERDESALLRLLERAHRYKHMVGIGAMNRMRVAAVNLARQVERDVDAHKEQGYAGEPACASLSCHNLKLNTLVD